MQEFVGKVDKKLFGAGSKSEHDAIMLETTEGAFVLRRVGGNPFSDPQVDQLLGKTIRCQAEKSDYTLTMSDWTVLNNDSSHQAEDRDPLSPKVSDRS
jgi:hypothetical protein